MHQHSWLDWIILKWYVWVQILCKLLCTARSSIYLHNSTVMTGGGEKIHAKLFWPTDIMKCGKHKTNLNRAALAEQRVQCEQQAYQRENATARCHSSSPGLPSHRPDLIQTSPMEPQVRDTTGWCINGRRDGGTKWRTEITEITRAFPPSFSCQPSM